MSETFTYDARNRLKTTKLSAAGSTPIQTSSYTYDNNGNIKSKSTFGATYVYDAIKVHAVRKVKDASGSDTASYDYDAAGRMLNQNGTDIVYTSFGQPQTLTKAGEVTSFKYNADLMRVVQDNADRVLTYLDPSPRDGGHLYEKEYVRATLTTIHRHFIYAPTGRIAEYEVKAKGTTVTASINYFLTDHLGSIDAVLPSTGDVVQIQRTSFDAFGARRSAGDWKSAGIPPSATLLGYTGHEQLDQVGLVHMNGRLYDPALGRFTSADPHIDGAGSTQGYNRYSYVQNNPMNATDPSGYLRLGGIFNSFRSAIGDAWQLQRRYTGWDAINKYVKGHEWAQQAIVVGVAVTGQWWAVAGASAYTTSLYTHDGAAILTAAFVGGVTSAMLQGMPGGDGFGQKAASVLAQGVVGGVSAAAGGGNFNAGFRSAMVMIAFAPVQGGLASAQSSGAGAVRMMMAAIAGGTASVIGGGKFANGAGTAAFGAALGELKTLGRQSVAKSGSNMLAQADGDTMTDAGCGCGGSRLGDGQLLWEGINAIGAAMSHIWDSFRLHSGEPIYRVYDGKVAKLYGRYWTPVDPRTIPDYRDAAGLPSTNSGEF